jgi:hypothetical protein
MSYRCVLWKSDIFNCNVNNAFICFLRQDKQFYNFKCLNIRVSFKDLLLLKFIKISDVVILRYVHTHLFLLFFSLLRVFFYSVCFCLYFCVLSLSLILCGCLCISLTPVTYQLLFFNFQDLITKINIIYFIINITSRLLLLLLYYGCVIFHAYFGIGHWSVE